MSIPGTNRVSRRVNQPITGEGRTRASVGDQSQDRRGAWPHGVAVHQPCVRCVLCSLAFLLVPALCSADSAAGEPALFAGFPAPMAECDFSRSCIIGYGSSPLRHGPEQHAQRCCWPTVRSPGSRTRRTCQVLRPRRIFEALAIDARLRFAFGKTALRRHPRCCLFRGSIAWPMRSPVNASPTPSRAPAHDPGSIWVASPFIVGTCTPYFLPVSRRTQQVAQPSIRSAAARPSVGGGLADPHSRAIQLTP
jgi:hypothetical protein